MFVLKFTVIIGVLEKVKIVNLIKIFLKTYDLLYVAGSCWYRMILRVLYYLPGLIIVCIQYSNTSTI